MENSTRSERARRWVERVFEAVDRFAFREPDLDAIARGWTVRRERRFVRTYRDPRWDTVTECSHCHSRTVIGAVCKFCGTEPAGRSTSAGSVGAS